MNGFPRYRTRFCHEGIVHEDAIGAPPPPGHRFIWLGHVFLGPVTVQVVLPETPITCLACLAEPLFTG